MDADPNSQVKQVDLLAGMRQNIMIASQHTIHCILINSITIAIAVLLLLLHVHLIIPTDASIRTRFVVIGAWIVGDIL